MLSRLQSLESPNPYAIFHFQQSRVLPFQSRSGFSVRRARDILLPLTVAALVYARRIDAALFFSDLDNSVQEWTLPDLTARISDRAFRTFEVIVEADGWLSLSTITEKTEQSKSTVIRHVNDLESFNVVVADTSEKAKRVRVTFSGELLSLVSQATV